MLGGYGFEGQVTAGESSKKSAKWEQEIQPIAFVCHLTILKPQLMFYFCRSQGEPPSARARERERRREVERSVYTYSCITMHTYMYIKIIYLSVYIYIPIYNIIYAYI
jgi:hypothetical protein